MIFNTEVRGIPCKCEVLDCSPDYDIRLLNPNGTVNTLATAVIDPKIYQQLLGDYQAEQLAAYWIP